MANDVLIEKMMTKCCAICGQAHEIEIRKRDSQALVKGESLDFEETYYLCADGGYEDNEYAPAGVMDQNLLRARDAYRQKYGLLTSADIAEIRKYYDLSQKDFALLLGWDEDAIKGFETKVIQSIEEDFIMRNFSRGEDHLRFKKQINSRLIEKGDIDV